MNHTPTPKRWAMLHTRCPRCRRGAMFSGGIYNFGSNKIYKHCPHCNLHFEIEPGYFYAAMYISYAMNVFEGFVIAALTYLVSRNTDSPGLYVGTIIGGLFVLSPINFRYSRVLLLYLMSPKINYQPHLDTDDSTPYL
ncbi:DUF983 domain-containing protein [Mucilaginibacter sp. L3T2-6]|uniref:DUF983 domain-containing protein n=1 Tax=Mucilaginibacter sp. L3T2-6 TaxID=3062491 RepID=UPI0026750346|nr:DUF983 domain-containing protein [Mucilaginibacter sp. L3T2-6]MDO3640436.1 DUF983 domain-containing protein [Mucilaginibacter sp. L3T2-6]MDV6213225.1 DUF983 domain-containing protein [Mucilaginibacter sp. L3T2-6]